MISRVVAILFGIVAGKSNFRFPFGGFEHSQYLEYPKTSVVLWILIYLLNGEN